MMNMTLCCKRLVRTGLALVCFGIATPAAAVTCTDPTIPASNPDSVYTDHGDGTVTDSRSGLRWKRCAEGQSWSGGTCSGTATSATWPGALGHAGTSTYANVTDWRLPNLKELLSLVEECRIGPAINDTVFPNAPSSYFLSGSPSAYNLDRAWYVHFYTGGAYNYSRSYYIHVRLVRGGQSYDTCGSGCPSDSAMIDHFYQNILGRAGEPGGVAFWQSETARLSALGADPTEAFGAMAVAFYTSAEFAARGLSDEAFIDSLYTTFFNRGADAGGRNYWIGQMNLGLSREMVMYSFLFSSEFASFMAQNFGSTPSRAEIYAVIDFYRGAFGRLPDSDGLKYWVNRFRTAQCTGNPSGPVYDAVIDIAGAFFESGEYWSSPAKTYHNHIGNFYNAFMRRGADVGGYLHWVTQLQSAGGANFNTLRRSFVDSPEFASRVQQIVNAGCTTLMQ